jgi:serine/threonine protein kinase
MSGTALGEGGMGVVYKAQDLKLNRVVALKFLPSEQITTPTGLERFKNEAHALSSLNYPNIATIYDIDEADGQRFIALELLPGGTLRSQVRQYQSAGRDMPLHHVVAYAIQIAEALDHAHKRNIVHRDVKTENILLTEDGKVKITDFGLAKLRSKKDLTRSGSTLGTAACLNCLREVTLTTYFDQWKTSEQSSAYWPNDLLKLISCKMTSRSVALTETYMLVARSSTRAMNCVREKDFLLPAAPEELH